MHRLLSCLNAVAPFTQETLTDADVLAAVNVETFPDGQAVALEAIFGNSATFDAGGAVSGAEAFMQVEWCRPNRIVNDAKSDLVGQGIKYRRTDV